ncbi:MAG: hypothetical protein AABY22_14265 [Nanoarchaeota archaeon]
MNKERLAELITKEYKELKYKKSMIIWYSISTLIVLALTNLEILLIVFSISWIFYFIFMFFDVYENYSNIKRLTKKNAR